MQDRKETPMSVEREDTLGNIKLNDAVFARLLLHAIACTEGKAAPASEKGKLLGGMNQKVSAGEAAANLKFWEEPERYCMEFYIIISFGARIQKVTDRILNELAAQPAKLLPDKSGHLVLRIVGIKSKKIAERNIEVVKDYEPAR